MVGLRIRFQRQDTYKLRMIKAREDTMTAFFITFFQLDFFGTVG